MILTVRDLTIQRGAVRILDRVSWSVAPGQHWVILGANGSGKTSLLSALTGYLSPTSGDITVLGQTFGESDWRDLRTHVGLVSSSIRQMIPEHEPALTTVISGRYAMIDYWGRITPRGSHRRPAASSPRSRRKTSPTDPGASSPKANASASSSPAPSWPARALLILDEPCAGLDPLAREHFLAFLQRLGAKTTRPSPHLRHPSRRGNHPPLHPHPPPPPLAASLPPAPTKPFSPLPASPPPSTRRSASPAVATRYTLAIPSHS